jgi:hemolysin activation/secretion protein
VTQTREPPENPTRFSQSKNVEFKLHRVLQRSQNNLLGMQFKLIRRFGNSFIEDTEIAQQRRNNTVLEIGLTHRHYFGAAQLDIALAHRQGLGWLGAQPDTLAKQGGPTWRYTMQVLDANLSMPFQIANQPLRYITTFHGQLTNNPLYFIDNLAIGSRYTVRGFDGETMLAAEKGFYWRNEVQMPLSHSRQSIYAGLDYGRVYGSNVQTLIGKQLAGAVIGIRGNTGKRFGLLSYDLFAGMPVYKPAGFPTAKVTVGFQAIYQY